MIARATGASGKPRCRAASATRERLGSRGRSVREDAVGGRWWVVHGGADPREGLRRAGPAVVPALAVVDAERTQRHVLVRRLDALGDHLYVAAVRELDQRADQLG